MSNTDTLEERLGAILSDPDSMAQLVSMAQSMGLQSLLPQEKAAPAADVPAPPSAPIDPEMLAPLMQLLQAAQSSDPKQEALVRALKPYLSPERRDKLDRAAVLARFGRLAFAALKKL